MAGYGNLFETDTESLLNEMNTLDQKPVYPQNPNNTLNTGNNTQNMNNSGYSAHAHQMQQGQHPQMAHMQQTHGQQHPMHQNMSQAQQYQAYNQHPQYAQYYQNQGQQIANINQKQQQQGIPQQQPNMQNMQNMNGNVPNPINPTSYMHSPMAPPPPPQPPPSGASGTQGQPTPPPQSPTTPPNANTTTIQNVQINVQNNFNIAKNNLQGQFNSSSNPGATVANGPANNGTLQHQHGVVGQNPWSMTSVNNSPYQGQANLNSMTPQQQQQYKAQQQQQQQQMYKLNQQQQYTMQQQQVPKPGTTPPTSQPMYTQSPSNPQMQQKPQVPPQQQPYNSYGQPQQAPQYTNGNLMQQGSPVPGNAAKMTPIPNHMQQQPGVPIQYTSYNSQSQQPNSVSNNTTNQQRQQSPVPNAYQPSPNKLNVNSQGGYGGPNGTAPNISVGQQQPSQINPQVSPNLMGSQQGQYYGQQQGTGYGQYQGVGSQQYAPYGQQYQTGYNAGGQQVGPKMAYTGGQQSPVPNRMPYPYQQPGAQQQQPVQQQIQPMPDPNLAMSPAASSIQNTPTTLSTPPETITPTKSGGRGKGKKTSISESPDGQPKAKPKRATKKKSVDGKTPELPSVQSPVQQQQHQSLYQQHQAASQQPIRPPSQTNSMPPGYQMMPGQAPAASQPAAYPGSPQVYSPAQNGSISQSSAISPNSYGGQQNVPQQAMRQSSPSTWMGTPPGPTPSVNQAQTNLQYSGQPGGSQPQLSQFNTQTNVTAPINGQIPAGYTGQIPQQPQPQYQISQQSTTYLQKKPEESHVSPGQVNPTPQPNQIATVQYNANQATATPVPNVPIQQQQPPTTMYQQQTVMTGQATPVSNSPSVSIVNPQVPTVTNGQPIIVQAQVVQRPTNQDINSQVLINQQQQVKLPSQTIPFISSNPQAVINPVSNQVQPGQSVVYNQQQQSPQLIMSQPQSQPIAQGPNQEPNNQALPQQQAIYQAAPANTASFLDQQQQLIQENLQQQQVTQTAKPTPAKKLTKKQLKKLEAGEELTADDLTPKKKAAKPRKIQPKPKEGLDNSVDSSSSQVEGLAAGDDLDSKPMPESTQANIDATLDDLMKQYKLKGKKKKKGEDDGAEESDSDESKSETEEVVKPAKSSKSRPKKPKKRTEDDSFDEFLAANAPEAEAPKKKKLTKKKGSTIAQLDENGLPINPPPAGAEADTIPDEEAAKEDFVCHLKAPVLPMIVQKSASGRRKNAMNNLAKLMKKGGRKRKKKTSSGEEDEEDDDSDEGYEVPAKRGGKKAAPSTAAVEAIVSEATMDTENDESTAIALQASENKRRSTRGGKRTKYVDEAISTADLIMPPTEAELAADAAAEAAQQEAAASNIVLTSQETLVIEKILGARLFKRKTMSKKPKVKKQKHVEIHADVKLVMEDLICRVETAECDLDGTSCEGEVTPMETTEEETGQVVEEKTRVDKEAEEKKEAETKSEEKAEHEEARKPESEQLESEYELSEWEEDGGEIEVEEFYVKYKSFSYLHCEWRTRDELFVSDKRIDQKIKRFRVKKSQEIRYDWTENDCNGYVNEDDELFNPDYIEVDRILDVFDMDDPANPPNKLRYYLVKWKTLPYEEASWELETDVKNPLKIARFYKFNTMTDIHTKHVPKPGPEKWAPMKKSRVYNNNNTIREYQLEGINWLTFCWLNSRNCILADEMGLGKTIQSLTFCKEMSIYGVNGPFLILVPLSTIGNWIREFETWTDFNCLVYHGSSASRQMLQDYEFYFVNNGTEPMKSNSIANTENFDLKKAIVKFQIFITTYEVLLSDVSLFAQFKWRSCIIDEAHRLKNKNCKLMEGLKYMDIEHKVLLTGTPLQNNVEELFSLLHFLEPLQFHSSTEFMAEFGNLINEDQVTKLQAVLKPMMLRRLKEDVEKNLAPKEETIVEVELTNTQKKYYRAILERNFQFLSRGASSSNVPNLMNTMMELRKCCNHPYLITGSEDQIIAEFKEKGQNNQLDPDQLSVQAMIQASGKLVLVDKLLPKLKQDGHKVLIFSQMIRVLDIIEDYLIQKHFTYERIDGRIRGELRQEAIDRYSKKDSDKFVFLLCTRAGGLGINLTAADTVIIYDSDWNPQNDLQAQARCHRIGQKKNVTIYRLITTNTYEREMFDKASLKLGLDKAILQSMRNEDKFDQRKNQPINPNLQLTKKEIEDLLKKGAYGSIMEDDTAADKFCEDDIDTLLSKRSTVITIEGGEKGSTFSKASFQAADTSDINIDDPEFWIKWAKKADIDVEEKLNPADERIIYAPRQRKQTRRFGGPDDILDSDLDSSSSDDENKDPANADPNAKGKQKKGKRSKRGKDNNGDGDFDSANLNDEDLGPTKWSRDECYKVEKNLLIFGWGRWQKILKNCDFSTKKKGGVQTEQDVESLSRCILAYALKLFNGDEIVKQFILGLVDPSKSNFAELRTASLSGPTVTRVKNVRPSRSKQAEKTVDEEPLAPQNDKPEEEKMDTTEKIEPSEESAKDETNKDTTTSKTDQSNAEIKQESDSAETKMDVEKSEPTSVAVKKEEPEETVKAEPLPEAETKPAFEMTLIELESLEWAKGVEDLLADETYKKHLVRQANRILLKLKTLNYIQAELLGAENAVKLDNEELTSYEGIHLPFPDLGTDLPANWWDRSCDTSMIIGIYVHGYEKYSKMRCDPKLCFLQQCGLPNATDLLAEKQQQEQEDNNEENAENGDEEKKLDVEKVQGAKVSDEATDSLKAFPAISEFNNRLRKLIAAHQKIKKQNELMSKRNAERKEKRLSKLASTQERAVMRQIEKQSKWSRREEQNFYRTISTFGVDCIGSSQYAWERFKEIGQLDKKLDETLNDYFTAFFYMCKKVCNKLTDSDKLPIHLQDLQVEVISEERATRCIQRVELLNKVRQDVLKHKNFSEWMTKCMTASDLPDWYLPVKHDIELVQAAARYGVTRTEYYYVIDSDFTFKESINKYMSHIHSLMQTENEKFMDPARNIDPIQYYFQSQAKIQVTFKSLSEKCEKKSEDKLTVDGDDIETVVGKLLKQMVCQTVGAVEGASDVMDDEEDHSKENNGVEGVPVKDEARSFEENTMFFGNAGSVPMILWPKDRVLFNRLELIIQMFENGGEWPLKALFVHPGLNGNPPVPPNPLSISNLVNIDQRKHMMSPSLFDPNDPYSMENEDNSNPDSDLLNRGRANVKPKRGRPPKYDATLGMTPEQPPRRNNQSTADSRDGYSSTEDYDDHDKEPDVQQKGKFLEPGEVMRPTQQKSDERSSSKRGRKPSVAPREPVQPKSPPANPEMSSQDAATAAALAAMFLAPGQDPEERISVINVENGTRLVGSKAPKRCELPMWLIAHPNYLPDESEILNLAMKQGQMNSAIEHDQSGSGSGRNGKSQKQSHSNIHHEGHDENSQSPKASGLKSQNPQKSESKRESGQVSRHGIGETPEGANKPAQGASNSLQASAVILFNKNTGKKLPPQKLPTWKSLCAFLDRNAQVFIDPRSNDLIRQKFVSTSSTPNIIKSRQINTNSQRTGGSNGHTDQLSSKHRSQQPHQSQSKHASSKRTPSESSSKSPPPRTSQPTTSSRSATPNQPQTNPTKHKPKHNPVKAPSQANLEAEFYAQQQAMLGAMYPFGQLPNMQQLSPNSASQLQGLTELLAASGAGNSSNPADQMQSLQSFMALMAAGQGGQSTNQFNGLGGGAAAGYNPFMLPPFGGIPPATNAEAQPPALADMLKLMGGKLPPGMDMSSFEELVASSMNLQQGQGPDSPSTKSTSSSSSNHEKSKNNINSANNRSSPMPKTPASPAISQNRQHDKHSRKSKPPLPLANDKKSHSRDTTTPKELPRPSSTSSTNSNNSHATQHQQQQNKKHNQQSALNNTSQTSEQAALAALIAQSGLQLDPNTNMAELVKMMEQDKLMQAMMMAGGGLPPGLDPSMMSALAANPFMFGGGAGGSGQNPFTPPQLLSPQVSSGSFKKQKTSGHKVRPSPSHSPKERSVSPASSVNSNISQQQQNQPDFGMLMAMMGGGMPGMPPMGGLGLGANMGLPSDMSQLPPELLAALSAAATGGLGAPGMPGLDPNMFSALAQLSSMSNNMQPDEATYSPNPSRSHGKSSSKYGTPLNGSSHKSGKSTPQTSSSRQQGRPGGANSSPHVSSRKSSRPQQIVDDDDVYQGLDLSRKTSSGGSREDSRHQKSSSRNN